MKKLRLILASIILGTSFFAGVAWAIPVQLDGNFSTQVLQPLRAYWGANFKASYFTATSSTATNVFNGQLQVNNYATLTGDDISLTVKRTDNNQAASVDYIPNGAISASNVQYSTGLLADGNTDNWTINIYDGATDVQPFVITKAGYVGIGTTSPMSKLTNTGTTTLATTTLTVFDKGGQVYDVRNYGALGNGVANDTAAIQAATNAALATGGSQTVYFPSGTYNISPAITATVAASTTLTFRGDGYGSILKNVAGSSSHGNDTMHITCSTTVGKDFIEVKDLHFVGNSTGGMGLVLDQCYQGTIENVKADMHTAGSGWGVGVDLTQTIDMTIINLVASKNSYTGLQIENASNANNIIGGWLYDNLAGAAGARIIDSNGNTFDGTIFETNADYGAITGGGRNNKFRNCWVENNSIGGIYLNDLTNIVEGCWFTQNTLDIDVVATQQDAIIKNNRFNDGGKITLRSGATRPIIQDNTNLTTITDAGAVSPSVTNAGKVGIGLSSLGAPFTVKMTDGLDPPTGGTTVSGLSRLTVGNGVSLDTGVFPNSPYGAWLQLYASSDQSVSYPLSLQPVRGNVGVGTSSPGDKFAVTGNSLFNGNITATGIFAASSGSVGAPTHTFSADKTTGWWLNGAGTLAMSVSGGKQWEFGSGSFYANAGSGLLIVNGDGNSVTTPLIVLNRADSTTGFAAGSQGNINAIVGGSELTRWTSTGFGVGTSSPWRKFSVTGTVGLDTSLTTAAGTPGSLCYNTATFEMTKNNALTCTVSSRTQKNDEGYMTSGGLDTLLALKPVQFAYKDNPERSRWGFYAEDVMAVDPKLADAYDDEGNPRSLDQNAILAVTVKAVQELAQDAGEGMVEVKRSAEENWQNGFILLLIFWNIWLTFKRK